MNSWRLPLPPRRWLQLRLRTVFLFATVLCLFLAWPHIYRQYSFWRLCQHGDRDFADLWTGDVYSPQAKSKEAVEIEWLVRQLPPRRSHLEEILYNGKPWLIRIPKAGRARMVIVAVRQPFSIPGSGDVRIISLNSVGRIIADKTISTGNRFFPRAVQYEPTGRSFVLVTVDSDYFWVGKSQRQYIAVRDERIAEVKITHSSSEPEYGRWRPDHYALGPDHRFANHTAGSEALKSSDQIDILEALLHLPPKEAIEARNPTDIERLKALSQFSDAWVREGATAALAEFDQQLQ